MKILMLTNTNIVNEGITEDFELREFLVQRGHSVDFIRLLDSIEDLPNDPSYYDIVVRRNSWGESEEEIYMHRKLYQKTIDLINNNFKNIPKINLEENMGTLKSYLSILYHENPTEVIPTESGIIPLKFKNLAEDFYTKEVFSLGSGEGQRKINKIDLPTVLEEGRVIQPKLKIKAEIQFYFVNRELAYALKYSPSKYPDYPEPEIYYPSEKEKTLAKKYQKLNHYNSGFSRVDFIVEDRPEDKKYWELKLLEIEITSPHMGFKHLPKVLKLNIFDKYERGLVSEHENSQSKRPR